MSETSNNTDVDNAQDKPVKNGRNPDGTFAYGNNANPNGRPKKGNTITDLLREKLDKETFVNTVVQRFLVDDGDKGRADSYAKLIWNYFDGMPKEYHPLPNDDENARDAKLWRLYQKLNYPQRQVIDDLERGYKLIINGWGRRTGKTEGNGYFPTYIAIKYPDAEMTYIHLTAKNALEQAAPVVMRAMQEVGHPCDFNGSKGYITHGNGGKMYFVGNESKDDREKMLGFGKNRRLIIMDECQSQKEIKVIMDEKLMATQIDCDATMILSGSKPRVRGTYWGTLCETPRVGKKINFYNMFQNNFLTNPMERLERLMQERGLSINDSVVRREFFNEDVYDDEALVLKVKDGNYYDDEQLTAWIDEYGETVRAVAGLDLGFEDADAIAVWLYSDRDDRLWLVHEETARRQSIGETVEMCNRALAKAAEYTQNKVYIMADFGGGGKKVAEDMHFVHKLPIMPAEKQSKDAAVEQMQYDMQSMRLKIRKGGCLDLDAMKLVYMRDDLDRITRTVDDQSFHSDIIDAALYSHREAAKHIRRA